MLKFGRFSKGRDGIEEEIDMPGWKLIKSEFEAFMNRQPN
jgi:hypothetical protein